MNPKRMSQSYETSSFCLDWKVELNSSKVESKASKVERTSQEIEPKTLKVEPIKFKSKCNNDMRLI